MEFLNIQLSSITLDSQLNTLRIPPRKEEEQQSNYKELFDYSTLFSDIYRTETSIELLGPPLMNLKSILQNNGGLFINGRDYTHLAKFTDNYRIGKTIIPDIRDAKEIQIHFENEIFTRKIQPNHYDFFKDHNVLVTQQKDNPLEWISYWVRFHVKFHEVDSILLYDNNSISYTTSQLEGLLSSIEGLKKVCVIKWPIPFGPTGGPKSVWDSDFGQHQAWEHALTRFLFQANCAIIGDIDELPAHEDNSSIPSILSAIDEPVLSYKRRQIIEVASCDEYFNLPRLHCYSHLYEKDKSVIAPKYSINPKKIARNSHLLVHQVIGNKVNHSDKIISRHFGNLRMDWRNNNYVPIKLKTIDMFSNELLEDNFIRDCFSQINTSWLK
ncbi:hypothetical protein LVJ83_12620 [Uruburuella testudinis]|uniref:Glycosyltransferase family 92 protein n=1 Tax=Uruburuella testudinis TaxID=1282863 RepID=A0ABY4DT25_9NEIS|nr:hypothetical protein [Uruburuella testudinis]UOO81742.1 hypothetical protein LVJ83_12620 [Uruburuella testudinis]